MGIFAADHGERVRDLLPLPFVHSKAASADFCPSSRSVARRRLKHGHTAGIVNDAILTFNQMHAGRDDCPGTRREPTEAQSAALASQWHAASQLGAPPDGLTCQGALSELRAKLSYGGEPASLAPLDVDLLALPRPGFTPISVTDIAGEEGRLILERITNKLLPRSEAEGRIKECGVKRVYEDPGLRRSRAQRIRLVKRLYSCGLIRYSKHFQRQVGAFTV